MRRAASDLHDSEDVQYYLTYVARLRKRKRELHEFIDSEPTLRNPRSMDYYDQYKNNGQLPFSGGYAEQPAWLIHDWNVIDLIDEYHRLPFMIERADKHLRELRERRRKKGRG